MSDPIRDDSHITIGSFYYPWYGKNPWIHWRDGDRNTGDHTPPKNWGANYLPQIFFPNNTSISDNLYSNEDPNTIRRQMQLMIDCGIQFGISSWWGQTEYENTTFDKIINQVHPTLPAEFQKFKWCILYEDEGFENPSVSQLVSDLKHIKNKFASSPYYLHIDGKPVIFVYNAAHDGSDPLDDLNRWKQAKAQVPFYIVFKVDPLSKGANPADMDCWYQYAPAAAYFEQQKNYSAFISPGFWHYHNAPRLRAATATEFENAVLQLKNAQVRFKLIQTWNEWGEGTGIEPAQQIVHDDENGFRLTGSPNPYYEIFKKHFANNMSSIITNSSVNIELFTSLQLNPPPEGFNKLYSDKAKRIFIRVKSAPPTKGKIQLTKKVDAGPNEWLTPYSGHEIGKIYIELGQENDPTKGKIQLAKKVDAGPNEWLTPYSGDEIGKFNIEFEPSVVKVDIFVSKEISGDNYQRINTDTTGMELRRIFTRIKIIGGEPIASLTAPQQVTENETVVLDGSQSIADTLDITQTSGQTVQLIDAGRFKKQFTAPTGNHQLSFQAVATKGTRTMVTSPITIQVIRNDIKFAAVGDTSCSPEAQKCFDIIKAADVDFFLALGDFSYRKLRPPSDPSNSSQDCWIEKCNNLGSKLFPNNIYPTIGNHDDENPPYRTEIINKFPHMPSDGWYTVTKGNMRIIILDTEGDYTNPTPQYSFVKSALEAAKNDSSIKWIIVCYHKPSITPNEKDHAGLADLRDDYHQLFDQCEVDLVFAGHRHSYTRTKPINYKTEPPFYTIKVDDADGPYTNPDGTIFIINGAGGRGLNENPSDEAFIAATNGDPDDENYGVVICELTNQGKTLKGKFISTNGGQVIDEWTINKP
jgi:hypothetical protein